MSGKTSSANNLLPIRTARLLLRDPVQSDIAALTAYHGDSRYLEFYSEPPDTSAIVETGMAWAAQSPRRNYQLIIENHERIVIGSAGVRTENLGTGEAEVGFELHPDHWRKGYGREILNALIELSAQLKVTTLYADTHNENYRAINLVTSQGFIRHDLQGERLILRMDIDHV